MNGNDTFLDVNDAHLRVTSGNVYASAFNLDQIDIVMSSNTASTVNFNNPTKAFNAASNIEVGTANLFVDTTTTRVGVGTASPATTLDVAGDLNVSGNLTIIGTRTTLDTEHLMVKDPIIELGKGNAASPVVDLGLVMTRPSGSSNVGIIFDESESTLEIGYTQGNALDSIITMQTADTEPLSVNVNGTISGNGSGLTALNAANITTGTLDRNTTGSAATLTTPRSIGGVNFDGSADIVPTTFGAATFDTDTLVIDSVNDRVGIGTTNPDKKLHVNDIIYSSAGVGGQHQGLRVTNTNINYGSAAGIGMYVAAVNNSNPGASVTNTILGNIDTVFGNATDAYMRFFVSPVNSTTVGDAKMVIKNNGNVGVGTATPLAPLDVKAKKGILTASSINDLYSNATIMITGTAENVDALCIGMLSTDTAGNSGNNPYAYIQNIWDKAISPLAQPLLLNPVGGNVGIGRFAAACALDIAGEDVMIRGNTPSLNFSEGTGAMDGAFRLRYDGANQADNNNFLAIQTGASFGITALHCTYDGKVGIGTTSPDEKLHVNGIVKATNLDLDGTVIRSAANITLTTNTWTKIADFAGLVTGGHYLISIKWDNSTLVGGGTAIWYGGVTYSTYVVGSASVYNATGDELINYNAHYHYRSISAFEFVQDSDASNGSYGQHSIYMKSPQSDVVANGVKVTAYRIG